MSRWSPGAPERAARGVLRDQRVERKRVLRETPIAVQARALASSLTSAACIVVVAPSLRRSFGTRAQISMPGLSTRTVSRVWLPTCSLCLSPAK